MNKINYDKELEKLISKLKENKIAPSLLLHSCCAPCSSYVLEYLADIFKITIYYYNPNISPKEEFSKRVSEQKRLISELPVANKINFIEGEYDFNTFVNMTKGLEDIEEGGERCYKCYKLRLEKTAQIAKDKNYDYFTTTLSVSPYKNSEKLNEIGKILSDKYGVSYLYSDFKKKNGYKRSIELSKQYNLYRQDYCGCIFSKIAREKQIAERKKRSNNMTKDFTNINVIHDDKNIIIVEKPHGLSCQSDKTKDIDLLTIVSEHIGKDAYLVHRLDRPVGGIMIFAKNKTACTKLSEQIQNKSFKKTYITVVCGVPPKQEDTLQNYMIKNQRLNMSKIVNKNTQNSKLAELTYKTVKTIETKDNEKLSLLEIDLKTGRHHQIRLQLSHIGIPIWGDTKYNKQFAHRGNFVTTALFSNSISFKNPTTNKIETYSLSYPKEYPFNLFS